MANYFTLSLELRQQILFEAFKNTDRRDCDSLYEFRELFNPKIAARIYEYAERLSSDPESNDYKRVRSLRYTPRVARLINNLITADPDLKGDLVHVVNKW